MSEALLYSLLGLANAVSQNLGFAHRNDVYVSFGEETITETNLLELRRRHPAQIRLRTFGKKQESFNGADWEWHIIGRARKLRMRVQAKRVQKNNTLKILHKVASSGRQQIDLLIADAQRYRLKPVYCLYSSNIQRAIWQKGIPQAGSNEFEYGCLLASAHQVKRKLPKTLSAIEADCVPWHYLVNRQRYSGTKTEAFYRSGDSLGLFFSDRMSALSGGDSGAVPSTEFPTIDELNADDTPESVLEGVAERESPDYEDIMQAPAYIERGISRLVR